MDILERLEQKLDVGKLKAVNKDVEDVMFTIRSKADKLLKHMRKDEFYTPALKKAHANLKKIQAELADLSNDVRSRM